jgi:hypothetical protein
MTTPQRPVAPPEPTRGRSSPVRDPHTPPPVSTVRRAGVLVVVGTLGMAILLASGGRATPPVAPEGTPGATDRTALGTPLPSAPVIARSPGLVPAVVPVIAPPETTLLRERSWTAQVTVAGAGMPLDGLLVRVFRNNREVMEPVPVRGQRTPVRRIPLRSGTNRITVSLTNGSTDGPRSRPVAIVVDDTAPALELAQPADGDTIDSAILMVSGTTDPGQLVRIRNQTVDAASDVTADDDGAFTGEVRIGPEANRIAVTAQDEAGNAATRTFTVRRGEVKPALILTLKPASVRLRDLPASIDVRAEVRDGNDRPLDDVAVTFSISPSGLRTDTFQTRTVDGIATWDDVVLPREGASAGSGLVTARAVLPGGIIASATKPFPFE